MLQRIQPIYLALLICLTFVPFSDLRACSMYKVTVDGRTMVGCNEDAWRLTPQIWFENATDGEFYGAAFTGSRWDVSQYTPQSGMNEKGLVFSRLATLTPEHSGTDQNGKKAITNPANYLKDILHCCETVADVQAYIEAYDFSFFSEDVFIYVDKSGDYLIVEPYRLLRGNDPTYVLANFCPSVTPDAEAHEFVRYHNGTELLKREQRTDLEFCTRVSDTMHVCRNKIGDGTLLTSIWDSEQGTVNLFFYHDYTHTVQFNLQEELAKGDHRLKVEKLFPANPEFEALRTYRVPKNTLWLMLFLVGCGGVFLFSTVYFGISFFTTSAKPEFRRIRLLITVNSLVFVYYLFVLCTRNEIFYFPSPYHDRSHVLVTVSSYLPFVLPIILVFFSVANYRILKNRSWSFISRWLFALNNVLYLILVGGFVYWGFYGF